MRSLLRRVRPPFLLALLLALTVAPAAGQQAEGPTPAEDRLAWFDAHVEMAASSPWRNLSWQHLGPTTISGRITDTAVTTPRGDS